MTNPVALKVLSWNALDYRRIQRTLSCRRFRWLTDWDVLLLQGRCGKLDGMNVGAHDLFTASELVGRDCDAQQPSCIRDEADKQKLLVGRADGLQSSWMDR